MGQAGERTREKIIWKREVNRHTTHRPDRNKGDTNKKKKGGGRGKRKKASLDALRRGGIEMAG